jgi:hypothetical protein
MPQGWQQRYSWPSGQNPRLSVRSDRSSSEQHRPYVQPFPSLGLPLDRVDCLNIISRSRGIAL